MKPSRFQARTLNIVLLSSTLLAAGACVDDGADTSEDNLGVGADASVAGQGPLASTPGSVAVSMTVAAMSSVPPSSAPGATNSSGATAQPAVSDTATLPTNPPALPTGGAAGAGEVPGQGEGGFGNPPGGDEPSVDDDGTDTDSLDASVGQPTDDDPFPGFPFPSFDDAGSEASDDSDEPTDDSDEPTDDDDSDDSTSSTDDTDTTSEPGGTLEVGKLEGMTQRHNELRAEVDTDEPLPPLMWSDEIAVLAQEWADVLAEDCSFEHSMRQGLGENLAKFGTSQQGGEQRSGIDAVDGWYSEIECYEYGTFMDSDSCSSECDQYGGCGHYTQVIWRETQLVGCGVSSCYDGQYYWDNYVCNYDPPGNYIGELPY